MTAPHIVYLARHGETDWNRDGRWQGQTDIPLNEAGRAQSLQLAERLRAAGVAQVTASDLSRARETAEIVARTLGVPFLGTDPGLRERNFGVFEGLTRDEVARKYPGQWADYTADRRVLPPQSEAHATVQERMLAALFRLALDTTPAHATLAVSHGGAIRLALVAATGKEFPPLPNGALFRILIENERFVEVAAL